MQTWPDFFDIHDESPACRTIKAFIEQQMLELEAYNEQRNKNTNGSHTYIFHEHAKRVAENVKRTCNHMNLGTNVAENMYWAVLPHDIGKKLLPADIWDQEEQPTGMIKKYRRTHTILGGQLIEELLHDINHPMKDLMLDIARHHHEQMDGKGTLEIAGKNLSAPVRLAAIVEAYDGWRIWRPHYGERDISPLGVLKRMREDKGAEIFDMNLFESFAEMKMNDYKEGRILQGY